MTNLILNEETLRYLNLGICSSTTMISIVSGIIIFINKNRDRVGTQYILALAIGNMILSISYMVECIFEYGHGIVIRYILYVAIFLQFLIPYMLMFILTLYIFYRVEDSGGWIHHPRLGYFFYFLAFAALCVFCWNGKYFYLTEVNEYRRGELYLVSQIIGVFFVLYNIGVLMLRGQEMGSTHKMLLRIYMYLPLIVACFQFFIPETAMFVEVTTLTLLLMVVIIQVRQTERYYINEKNLTDVQVKLMLAQMRPHFLYNALSSISQLCRKNPAQASEMTDRFAEFLRKNMNDMDRNQLIPIEKELAHIDNYISIEQMRFGDMIRVKYDIQEKDFSIPSLVLQPVVENAIRHGIRGREDGGLIQISTKKTAGCYLLTVVDDGVGFDTKKANKDDRVHLGLDSVKRRMEIIPNASFMISSTPGIGTTAVFLIPAKGTKKKEIKMQLEKLKTKN